MTTNFTSKLWTSYANWLYTRWEKTYLWDLVEPYRRPRSFKPLVSIYIFAFYTGVIGSAITEQLYKTPEYTAVFIIATIATSCAIASQRPCSFVSFTAPWTLHAAISRYCHGALRSLPAVDLSHSLDRHTLVPSALPARSICPCSRHSPTSLGIVLGSPVTNTYKGC
ncbi:Uncharacterized protein EJ110_NYTH57413 [Nymphaea thermarum]|nr:Uncharacterized protein EJ110_NYTH57413 [Nymphaea thermarum]